jgi:hypothetical protein
MKSEHSRYFKINGYDIYEVTYACPQQFEVLKDNVIKGYFRIRHGKFSVYFCEHPFWLSEKVIDSESKEKDAYHIKLIYQTYVLGDGLFEEEEESFELEKAIIKLDDYLKSIE